MWQTVPLSDELFTKSFLTNIKFNDEYGTSTPMVVDLITKLNKSKIKWLIIGPGFGNWEVDIMNGVKEANGEIEFETIEAWEPNPHMFRSLKKTVQQDKLWGKNLSKIYLKNQSITVESTFDKKFDIITLPHVFYYIKKRQEIINLLESALEPQGIIYSTCVVPEIDGEKDHVVPLFRTFQEKISLKNDIKSSDYVEGDYFLSGYDLYQDFKKALDGKDITVEVKPWKAYTYLGKLEKQEEFVVDIISFFMQCDIGALPQAAKDEIFLWLKENTDANKCDGTFRLFQPNAAVIAYKK